MARTVSIEVPDEMEERAKNALAVIQMAAKKGEDNFKDVTGVFNILARAMEQGENFEIMVAQSVISERLRRL